MKYASPFVGLLSVAVAACNGDVQPMDTDAGVAIGTQLVVQVDTESNNLPDWLQFVNVEAEGPTGEVEGSTGMVGDVDFPVTVGVVAPPGSPNATVRVEAWGRTGRGNVVSTSRTTRFVEGETLLLELELEESCLRVACPGADETCEQGTCRNDFVAPEALPRWTPVSGG